MNKEIFEELYHLNVNDYTEDKNGLTYLTWSYAWAEVKKRYPNATYEIEKFENNLPYVYDENVGYMVFTKVTIEDVTHEMWLPVMDGANKAMKKEPYKYKVKVYKFGKWTGEYAEKVVESADMFDINKTIMRCLVKNLAMFGLGLYIYAGEDLPEQIKQEEDLGELLKGVEVEKDNIATAQIKDNITTTQVQALEKSIENNKIAKDQVDLILEDYGYKKIDEIKKDDYGSIVRKLKELVGVSK